MNRPFLRYFVTRFIISFGVLLAIYFVFIFQIIESRRDLARSMAQESISHVEIILNNMIEKTDMVEGFLHSMGEDKMRAMMENLDGKTHLQEFNLFASMLYDTPAIKGLQLLPKGIMLYSYPLAGNEAAIGDNVLEREITRETAEYAMLSGLTTIDGPRKFLQGGIAMVARNPVYLNDGTFWGFSAISMSLPEIIEPFGLNDLTRQGYEYRFVMMNFGKPVEVGSTLQHHQLKDCVSYSKLISGRRVTLHIIPRYGWLSAADACYGLIFFLVVALVIAYLATRNKQSSMDLIDALQNEKHMRELTAQAYNEAEQANKAKSNFLSAMSHDLRTPMNAIVGLCTLLARDSGNQQKVADYARKISASSQHLLGLINDILDMSKIESGKVSVNAREFSLAELIENVNTIVRPQAHGRHQAFDIHINSIEHELLIGDDLRVNQILLNLLSNAVKYTQVGGHVCLTVTEEPKRSNNNIASYIFEVRDNGMGMTEDFLKHIFEPFARSETAMNTRIQGTGLGMTITNNLIKLLGGTIDVKSREGEGTTITVNLSFKIHGVEVNDRDFFATHNISNVLIIDDDISDFKSVEVTLSEAGVKSYHARGSADAMEILASMEKDNSSISLILLDLKLENEDGVSVARTLNQSSFKDIPVIMLSSYDYSEVELDAMEAGVSHFLNKPLFLSSLKQALDTMSHRESADGRTDGKGEANILEGLNILAAEDNELNSEILVDLLSMRGAHCKVCSDGVEVVEEFSRSLPGTYDIILMDVQMPRKDGLEATRDIRNLDRSDARVIPVIAMTANAFSEDIKASLDAGMNYHVSKPIDFKLLEMCIKDARARWYCREHPDDPSCIPYMANGEVAAPERGVPYGSQAVAPDPVESEDPEIAAAREAARAQLKPQIMGASPDEYVAGDPAVPVTEQSSAPASAPASAAAMAADQTAGAAASGASGASNSSRS